MMYPSFVLCALALVVDAKWDDIFHKVTPVVFKGRIMCGQQPAAGVTVVLVDDDFFKDDVVDAGITDAKGNFTLVGQGRDFKWASEPDLYLKVQDTCGMDCKALYFDTVKMQPDGSIVLQLPKPMQLQDNAQLKECKSEMIDLDFLKQLNVENGMGLIKNGWELANTVFSRDEMMQKLEKSAVEE